MICRESGCERPSCRPDDYAPLCTRHYLASVKQAEADAAAQFQAKIEGLLRVGSPLTVPPVVLSED